MAKYNNLTLGQIEAIVNRLGGMTGVEDLLAGRITTSMPRRPSGVWGSFMFQGGYVDITIVTPRELGFEKTPTWEQVYRAAEKLGMDLLTRELGEMVFAQTPISALVQFGAEVEVGMLPILVEESHLPYPTVLNIGIEEVTRGRIINKLRWRAGYEGAIRELDLPVMFVVRK